MISCLSAQISPQNITLSDDQLLDMVQNDTLKYFWDYAHPISKLARERYHTDNPLADPNTIAIGGSGFGMMSIIVGVERGFVQRSAAVSRLTTALDFLTKADRFHGAWSHWISGTTGKVIPFGSMDDGGDIVETAYLCQGLITVREYFKNGSPSEQDLANKADLLWRGVEWNWYTNNESAVNWHWSPKFQFAMNMKVSGYNEALIVFILGMSSPTYPINVTAYKIGWAGNGRISNNFKSYSIPIYSQLTKNCGPLFFEQYSYLGLDPRGLTDVYGDYFKITQNHAKIIYDFCVKNPNNWTGYSVECWGLTASYTITGYTAHSPTNDLGVISPTAALAAFPYTPVESMRFLRFLYEKNKGLLVGVAGPYDSFSSNLKWITKRYLAIDQGPIGPMIENYRSQLLWKLFMNAAEIRKGLIQGGFHSTQYSF